MNLLAHALLTPPGAPAGVVVGNVAADWIKGRVRRGMSEDFRAGFELHRAIDVFTDTHPQVANCCALLEPRWNRYAPVLVDIFFDHVLCESWLRHSAVPREDFIAATYRTLAEHLHLLPERARHAGAHLIAHDWFACYATLGGVELCLSRLSSRLNHGIDLSPAVEDFAAQREEFQGRFEMFFPALRRHVEDWALVPLH